ncbi:hypothetical protein Ppb6_01168 [Photorhabdus australis subsp. thailandensis]|uniref:Ribbon-helix-helix protein CopG domain-containing protein n=1 Tax=Photorhabdus australis subsp. thailandensis TaxID=2805096 RepID=A0A1C0U6H6_9GAMM|nr:hypothetical protein [Photorhabdus australis]OCQ53542.1 hypothetical protein Ppb6_01168 [Photorhabdus australis subsp. thailandensis]
MDINLDTRKKSEKMQLRTTEFLKDQICKLANKDGISQNSVMNQALAWYVNERAKNAV